MQRGTLRNLSALQGGEVGERSSPGEVGERHRSIVPPAHLLTLGASHLDLSARRAERLRVHRPQPLISNR